VTDNKTVCAAFWTHTNIRGGNRIFPCCRYKSSVQHFNGDVQEILYSDEYNILRQNSLEGIKNSNCQKCYDEESQGLSSFRNWFNENYSREEVQLKYLEAGFDNICNLACDGCWEEWSSTWWIKKNPNGVPKAGILNTEEFYNVPNTLEKVVFLGGEPLMTNRHRKFLLEINQLSNLDVSYYTNGMFDITDKDKELLNKCKSVTFFVSIDAVGKLNDRVRTGSNWPIIEKFVDNCPYKIIINSVIHRNNWHGIIDLYNWVQENNFVWKLNVLTFPESLSITSLDDNIKKEVCTRVNELPVDKKDYVLSFLGN